MHAGRYIHGVAVHWYLDSFVPAETSLGTTHHIYPEYYLFGTEACAGWSPTDRGVKLGSWDRAEQYAHDIIEVTRLLFCSCGLYMFSQMCFNLCTIWQAECFHRGESPPSLLLLLLLQCKFTFSAQAHRLQELACRPPEQAGTGVMFLLSFCCFLSREIRFHSISLSILHVCIQSLDILRNAKDLFV